MTDIDIDFADPEAALWNLHCVRAVTKDRLRHNSGVYFQDIPTDPLDGMAVWNYKDAEDRGYFKIDFLKNSIYDHVTSESHLIDLLTAEPPWERLSDPQVVGQLAHIHGHFDIVQMIEPRTIEDLAVCLALIRPGKRHLTKRPRYEIMRDIWTTPTTDDFVFKRSHAISYAASIVVQLNLLIEQGV